MVKRFTKKSTAKKWAKKTRGTQSIWKTRKGYAGKTVKRRRKRR